MNMNEISKFIALILRHKPEVINICLNEQGWANVDELIEGINNIYPFTRKDLELIVKNDQKQRYSFNGDQSLIRANQGHSISVDVELKEAIPPIELWHGTGEKYVDSIDRQGLLPKSRLYVHLSSDIETAVKVGARHGIPVIYKVNTKRMVEDGYTFYLSENNIWLTKFVPINYLIKQCPE